MRWLSSIAALSLLIFGLSGQLIVRSSFAEEPPNDAKSPLQCSSGGNVVSTDSIDPGDVIAPKAVLPLRASPPGGFLGLKGAQIGEVEPNKSYRVVEEKDVRNLFGAQKWIKVHPITGQSRDGWVFTGYVKSNPTTNISVYR